MERQPPVTGLVFVAGFCAAPDAERWMTNP